MSGAGKPPDPWCEAVFVGAKIIEWPPRTWPQVGRSLRGRVPAPVLGVHGLELAVDLRQPAAVLPLEQLVADVLLAVQRRDDRDDRFKARSEAQARFAKNAKERSIRVLFASHWGGLRRL